MINGSKFLLLLYSMVRRFHRSVGIVLLVMAAAIAAALLQRTIERQKNGLSTLDQTAQIRCIMTDENGTNSEGLSISSMQIAGLCGRNNLFGELSNRITAVQAIAETPVELPDGFAICRILSFSSVVMFAPESGVKISLFSPYDESIFKTEERVCLVPNEIMLKQKEIKVQFYGEQPVTLRIIGTVSGGAENTIYCPFFMQTQHEKTKTSVFFADRCSFLIRNNTELAKTKQELFTYFSDPVTGKKVGKYGVVVQDDVYCKTREKMLENIELFGVLRPILLVLCWLLGGASAFLTGRTRRKEFVLMRTLGVSCGDIFCMVLVEFLLLGCLGCVLGLPFVLLIARSGVFKMLLWEGLLLSGFLIGAWGAMLGTVRMQMNLILAEE